MKIYINLKLPRQDILKGKKQQEFAWSTQVNTIYSTSENMQINFKVFTQVLRLLFVKELQKKKSYE